MFTSIEAETNAAIQAGCCCPINMAWDDGDTRFGLWVRAYVKSTARRKHW